MGCARWTVPAALSCCKLPIPGWLPGKGRGGTSEFSPSKSGAVAGLPRDPLLAEALPLLWAQCSYCSSLNWVGAWFDFKPAQNTTHSLHFLLINKLLLPTKSSFPSHFSVISGGQLWEPRRAGLHFSHQKKTQKYTKPYSQSWEQHTNSMPVLPLCCKAIRGPDELIPSCGWQDCHLTAKNTRKTDIRKSL